MQNTWVLVADSTRARFFVASSSTPLTEFETFTHLESSQHEQKMTSDLSGSQAGSDGRHHGVSSETDPKKYEAIEFARTISHFLEDSRNKHIYTQLILIAAPAFLGLLREHLTAETAKMVIFELDKNLSQHSIGDIQQHLPKKLMSKII